MQSFFQTFGEFINRKSGRMALAALCLTFFVQSIFTLVSGSGRQEMTNALGGILFWGGWTAINTLRAYGRTVAALNMVANVGIALIILSLFIN